MRGVNVAIFLICLSLLVSCAKKELRFTTEKEFEDAFADANKLIAEKSYEEARDLLNKIRATDTASKFAPIAQLRIADSYLEDDEPELAIEEFRRFLDIYAGNKYAAYAQYQIAMTYFKQVSGPERGSDAAKKALAEFETLRDVYPRSPYRDSIEPMMLKCMETIADYEFLVGEFYFKKKAYKGALARFLEILDEFPDYKGEPDVLYRVYASYKGLGEGAKSTEYRDLLIKKYPESKAAGQAKEETQAQ